MAELINMPKLGFDMKEGQLINWLVKPGDQIEQGQIVAEIESDKATVEVEAYTSGTVLELLVEVDEWVPIGKPIAVIGEEGESYDLAAMGGEAVEEKDEEETAEPQPATSTSASAAAAQPETSSSENGKGFPAGVRASPLARRVAEEKGIDLSRVEGSGPQGRVVRADVESYTEAPSAPARSMPAFQPVKAGPDSEEVETPRLRRRIAQRMTESKQTVPHFYVTTDVDMKAALDLRRELNERRDKADRISVNDLIVKAAALTLRDFPNINASYNGDTLIRHNHINVGIAVAVEGGLLNVVSKDADITPLTAMGRRHREMITRAREGKIKPEDVDGETFTVSNLGAYDVDHFIAIINPPAAAILAVGSAKDVPVVVEGELTVGTRMKGTISADHRVTDGVEAAEFMQRFKELLEDPLQLLM